MSRHTCTTLMPVYVTLGYDRPLRYIHCTIECNGDVVYSNLDDPDAGTECQDVEYFRQQLADKEIFVPEALFEQTVLDQRGDVGNRIMTHDMDGDTAAAIIANVLAWVCPGGDEIQAEEILRAARAQFIAKADAQQTH